MDGFYRANWKLTEEGGVATLTIDRFAPQPSDPSGTHEEIEAEAAGLLEFISPGSRHRVEFVPNPGR